MQQPDWVPAATSCLGLSRTVQLQQSDIGPVIWVYVFMVHCDLLWSLPHSPPVFSILFTAVETTDLLEAFQYNIPRAISWDYQSGARPTLLEPVLCQYVDVKENNKTDFSLNRSCWRFYPEMEQIKKKPGEVTITSHHHLEIYPHWPLSLSPWCCRHVVAGNRGKMLGSECVITIMKIISAPSSLPGLAARVFVLPPPPHGISLLF